MNKIQYFAYSLVGMSVTASTSFAAIDPGIGKVDPRLVGNDRTLDQAIMGYIGVAMTFLAIIGVLYGIWGGFLMLTAGGEEEKVKKGRTILVQVAIGLLVIALSYSLVKFVVSLLFSGTV